MKKLILLLATILTWPAFTLAFANSNDDWYMGEWGHMMGGTVMWVIFPVIVLIVLGFVIYFILQSSREKSSGSPSTMETPMDILKKRYAKGEITKEEFDRMKKDLKS